MALCRGEYQYHKTVIHWASTIRWLQLLSSVWRRHIKTSIYSKDGDVEMCCSADGVCLLEAAVLVVSSRGSLTELLSKPLWAQTIYPLYREVIIEVDYTRQQNLISKPLRNAGWNGWIKILGQSLFQIWNVNLHSI